MNCPLRPFLGLQDGVAGLGPIYTKPDVWFMLAIMVWVGVEQDLANQPSVSIYMSTSCQASPCYFPLVRRVVREDYLETIQVASTQYRSTDYTETYRFIPGMSRITVIATQADERLCSQSTRHDADRTFRCHHHQILKGEEILEGSEQTKQG